jgi:hypothetical protein
MMKLKSILGLLLLMQLLFLSQSCKKDKTLGLIEGTVTDAQSGSALSDVRIIVFDVNTNAPSGITVLTNASGKYSIEITEGNYYLKLYKQGYNSIPPASMSAIPVEVIAKETTVSIYSMTTTGQLNDGFISGRVTEGSEGRGGVLVVASTGQIGFSTVSDANGNYYIYNIPAGTYSVQGWKSGYNSATQSVTVNANTETSNVNLTVTAGASGSVTGQITFLATTNIEVDVALVHPITKEVIPGLNGMTSSFNYTISNVPNGTFIARASFENDGKVVDPDWLVKNGEPLVTVASNSQSVDFSCTGTVTLNSPTNTVDTKPVISSAAATFSWTAYPSASDYVIEVMDANGRLIWGGFDYSGGTPIKNIIIPSSQTSIQFNSDGNAPYAMLPGHVYRWRVYASKDAVQSPTGWNLISVSEDQKGLIEIQN